MYANSQEDTRLAERANELYWHSDDSVNHIADELGVSKGGLYDLVIPLNAGFSCPDCGAGMVYPNRTARERGFLVCPECGFEVDEESVEAPAAPTASSTAADRLLQPDRVILGTVLVGVAVGVLIANYFRRR